MNAARLGKEERPSIARSVASSTTFAAGDPFEIGIHALDSIRETAKSKCLVCARTADAMGMIGRMPTISRFFGIAIVMFFDDHGFPHFHARHAEGEAKVRIDNLEVMDSNLGRRQLRFVLVWAELHQQELEENWRRARAGETLLDIEPLK
jgi:Domain of unknown function (DUF4160)